jgi:hypothetical protein
MRRAYWGDLQLPTELQAIVPQMERGSLQVHQGVDRDRALIVSTSPNLSFRLDVQCFWEPESDYSKRAFRARERAVQQSLANRAKTAYPVVWIEADTPTRTVSGFSGSTVTCASHGLSNGDVVLIRRNGVGLYTVSAVGGVTSSTFTVSAGHAIQNGDNIFLVEQYHAGCTFAGMSPIEPAEHGDYYAEQVSYSFATSGSLGYARTSVTLP